MILGEKISVAFCFPSHPTHTRRTHQRSLWKPLHFNIETAFQAPLQKRTRKISQLKEFHTTELAGDNSELPHFGPCGFHGKEEEGGASHGLPSKVTNSWQTRQSFNISLSRRRAEKRERFPVFFPLFFFLKSSLIGVLDIF